MSLDSEEPYSNHMDENLSKLKTKIGEIESLKGTANWGPEFQLWKNATNKLVREIFGEEGLSLFEQQQTRTTSYIDKSYNVRQYQKELDNRKKIIEGLLAETEEHRPSSDTNGSSPTDVLREIWRKEEALKENLLTTKEAESLYQALISHLETVLKPDSLPGLRFRKLQSGKKVTWWSNEAGYPVDNPWQKFGPFLDLLAQYEAEKTIKRRLEIEGLFVESRSQGEDQHLLIGEKDGSGDKAHITIDGKSAEIRTEDGRQEPTDLVSRIETILTLPSGKKIKTTREIIEEMS